MNVVLLGPPGAGKGTQATRLSEAFGFRHLSSGDLLRAERQAGSELGRKVARYMDAGTLVPDEIMVEVILERLRKNGDSSGFLLDGFPRTSAQAESLDRAMDADGHQVDMVLSLEVPDTEVVDRITGRRICPTCGRVYHVRYHPPRQDGVCDADGQALVQRPDDTAEVVQQRLHAYHEQTVPLKTYYRQKGLLVEADGTQDVDRVAQECRELICNRSSEVGS